MEIENIEQLFNVLSTIKVHQIIIYLRKSRNEEKEDLQVVLARHEKMLQDYAIRNFGERIPEENIFREVVSGETIDDRIEIKKVFNKLADEDIKAVLVVEPQRLSRGDMEDCGRVVNVLRYSNTLCITLSKTYDLNNKFDRKIFEMELTQGNEYLEYTKTILKRGKKISLEEGKYIYSTAPFGYGREKLDKGFKLVPHPVEAPIVKMMFELFVESMSSHELANYLNQQGCESRTKTPWNYGMVNNILENETYYGVLVNEKRKVLKKLIDGERIVKTRPRQENYLIVKGLHEPLISKEMYELAQAKIKNNPNSRTGLNRELKNPLAGVVFCSYCGRSLVRNPCTRKHERKKVRAYEINKLELSQYLTEHKKQTNLSLQDIANELNLTKALVAGWFRKKEEKIIYSDVFTEKWPELKKLLNIKGKKFDKEITTYKEPEPRKDMLQCPDLNCKNVSSTLDTVEAAILKKLEETLDDYKYFLDNYEQEAKKKKTNNEKRLKQIETKLSKFKVALRNARRDYNEEKFSYEEYLEDKKYYEAQIEELEKEKNKLSNKDEEEIIIQYKKAVPILANCIKQYNTLESITDKNELLKSFIEKIVYKKTKRMNWRRNDPDDMELTIYM